MDFKAATDALFDRVTHDDLADAMGISVAAIRQARLNPRAEAHRAPPSNWEPAIVALAEKRIAHFRKLAELLKKQK